MVLQSVLAVLACGVATRGPGLHRASVQNTSAALSCKYHQQLVARKLVVPNESLAYMWGGFVCLPANCFNRSSASAKEIRISDPFCKALLLDCKPFNWTVMRAVFVLAYVHRRVIDLLLTSCLLG